MTATETVKGTQAAPPDPGEIFAELPRPDGALRVALASYKGNPLVSIRVWYRNPEGQLRPCRSRGLSIRIGEVEDVAIALQKLIAAYHQRHEPSTRA